MAFHKRVFPPRKASNQTSATVLQVVLARAAGCECLGAACGTVSPASGTVQGVAQPAPARAGTLARAMAELLQGQVSVSSSITRTKHKVTNFQTVRTLKENTGVHSNFECFCPLATLPQWHSTGESSTLVAVTLS